jgi:hypothetical protein
LLEPHIEQNEPLKSVAQAAGIPYRTAHRLVPSIGGMGLPLWYVRNVRTGAVSASSKMRLRFGFTEAATACRYAPVQDVTKAVVEAARESLVIGEA